jgi:hypothetical protein
MAQCLDGQLRGQREVQRTPAPVALLGRSRERSRHAESVETEPVAALEPSGANAVLLTEHGFKGSVDGVWLRGIPPRPESQELLDLREPLQVFGFGTLRGSPRERSSRAAEVSAPKRLAALRDREMLALKELELAHPLLQCCPSGGILPGSQASLVKSVRQKKGVKFGRHVDYRYRALH